MTDDAPLLLDVTRLIWRRWRGRLPTGIDRVCLAYLRHFGSRSQAVIQHDRFRGILGRDASADLFELLEEGHGFRSRLLFGALRHAGSLSHSARRRLYLNVGHTGLNSSRFRAWLQRSDARPVYFVHDLIPVTHPEFCRPGEVEKHRDRMRTVLATAPAGIIGNSRTTLDELRAFAAAEDLPAAPSLAAWLGVDPLPMPRRAVPSRPTFVILGTIEARKNHLMLLDIWSRMVRRLGTDAPQLLIIGQRGWEAEAAFRILDTNAELRGHVIELSRCSDQQLADHLASARALLFPSLAEGYGLPLVEALGAGVPVVASDLPVFREIAGDAPDYLSPLDEHGWEEAILAYSETNSPARAAQLGRMADFRAPTWNQHFAAVDSWLAGLA